MKKYYLFDWGDTLMVDDPNCVGKMCDWPNVQTIDGAKETLQTLSQHAQIYIATGAADSSEADIKRAFERVALAPFISGYFCQKNLGVNKGNSAFFNAILAQLMVAADQVVMVGDNFDKDIAPAIATGMQAYWLTNQDNIKVPNDVTAIKHLAELLNILR